MEELSEAFSFHQSWRLEVHDDKVGDGVGHMGSQDLRDCIDQTAARH